MLRIVALAIALAFGATLAQPAAAQSGVDLVKQAVAAQGGAAAVSEPGQSYSPTGEAKFLGESTYTQSAMSAFNPVAANDLIETRRVG